MASDIAIGTILADRYEILSELGRGRVGIVYKAVHRRLEKHIAVKVLFEDVTDETAMKRFEHEARSTSRLNHPNTIDVLDYGSSRSGLPYLIMEYIEGSDLQEIVSKEKRFSLARTVRIISQVSGALAHAHNKGIIHRDLKPSNIMLMDFEALPDFVKLVDFGIAKRYDGDEVNIERLTADGQVLGTPAYMSPEQCQAGKLDARSDIYSLGCVMFKMLTGVAPIAGSSIIDIIHNHIAAEPLSFAEACPDVRFPPGIQEVVMTALAKDPRKRQQTMFEFANLLNAAAGAIAPAAMGGLASSAATTSGSFRMGQTIGGGSNAGNGLTLPPGPMTQAEVVAGTVTGGVSAEVSAAAEITADDVEVAAEEEQREAETYRARTYDKLLDNAEKGDARAQFELAVRLQNGDGIDSDQNESLKWLRKAANNDNRDAQYRLGKRLLEGDDRLPAAPAEGFTWLHKAAEQGLEPAQVMVAICYEEGRGTTADVLRAIHYYRKAVHQGNDHAKPKLSALYERCQDNGIEAEGFDEWLESQAEEGDIDSLYMIACVRKGHPPLSRDNIVHLQPAAEIGNYKAQMALAKLYMENKQPDDLIHAYHWTVRASENKNANGLAMLQLAAMMKNGIGCPKDPAKATQLLQQAGDMQGNYVAMALLGSVLLTGDGVPRNLTRGISYLKTAAAHGSSLAAWKLGLCMKNGLGALRDTKEAEKWFDKAAEGKFDQGPQWQSSATQLQFKDAIAAFQTLASVEHRQAHYWLGICYENGIGVPRDLNKALDLYMKSANKGCQPALDAANKLKAASAK